MLENTIFIVSQKKLLEFIWQKKKSMAVQMDPGPRSCVLLRALQAREESASITTSLMKFADADDLRGKAFTLHILLERCRALDAKVKSAATSWGVAAWVHSTIQMEDVASLESEDSTRVALEQIWSRKQSDCIPSSVITMSKLLDETYIREEDVSFTARCRRITREALNDWQHILLPNIEPGVRTAGLLSFGDGHVYPHHLCVPFAMDNLLGLLHSKLAPWVDEVKDGSKRICRIFAVAAFLQYHFADIRPYVDGNGWLCRFLSKFLLDACLPFPIPMFRMREKYISSLAYGRQVEEDPMNAPSVLCDLMFSSATEFYANIVQLYTHFRPVICTFGGAVVTDLKFEGTVVSDQLEIQEQIKHEFDILEPGFNREIEYGDGVIWVFKNIHLICSK